MARVETQDSDGSEVQPMPSSGGASVDRPRAPGRWVVRGVLVLAGVVVLVLGVQSVLAYTALRQAQRAQRQVTNDLDVADLAAVQRHAADLRTATKRAREAVWGPWWALPEAVPWYGDDIRAARLTVRVLDDVTRQAAVPLVTTTAQIADGLHRPDGSLDVDLLDRLQVRLTAASGPADDGARQLDRINPAGLARPLRRTIVQVRDGVGRLASTVRSAEAGLVVTRALVGATHPRTTLLAVQNPAEARGTGGIISVWAVLRGSRGKLDLAATGVNNQLIRLRPDAARTPVDVLELYGNQMLDVRNINMSPDFPVAAGLLATRYRQFSALAGLSTRAPELAADSLVLTVTPRALSRLLSVTGPVRVSGYDRPITTDNAASLFTNGVYRILPDEGQRTLFVEQVLVRVFARLRQPGVEPVALVRQLHRMIDDRDVMAWSPEPRVQSAIARLGMSGLLPAPDGSTAQVSLVNIDGSKLDYYLRGTIRLSGSGDARSLDITLRNTAPETVPAYVRNQNPSVELPSTTHDVVVQVHLPPNVEVTQVLRDLSATGVANGSEAGWHVLRVPIRLARDKSATLRVLLTHAPDLETVVPPVMTSTVDVTISARP